MATYSGFSHKTWWLSAVILNYQRVNGGFQFIRGTPKSSVLIRCSINYNKKKVIVIFENAPKTNSDNPWDCGCPRVRYLQTKLHVFLPQTRQGSMEFVHGMQHADHFPSWNWEDVSCSKLAWMMTMMITMMLMMMMMMMISTKYKICFCSTSPHAWRKLQEEEEEEEKDDIDAEDPWIYFGFRGT